MAWIKIRHGLDRDPSVIQIAEATGLDEDTVVGKLVKLWCWADAELTDGNARCVTFSWLDRYVSVTGFGEAMQSAGWIIARDGGIAFPKFERHMGESAKRRAQAQSRAAASRCRNAEVTQTALRNAMPDESKMRDAPNGASSPAVSAETVQLSPTSSESETASVSASKRACGEKLTAPEQGVVDAWNSQPAPFKAVTRLGARLKALRARLADPWWRENWQDAIARVCSSPGLAGKNERGWVADFTWFIRPDTVAKLLEGKYDNWGAAPAGGRVSELNAPDKWAGHPGA